MHIRAVHLPWGRPAATEVPVPPVRPRDKDEALGPPVLPIPLSPAEEATASGLFDWATVPAGTRLLRQGHLAQQALVIASGSAIASRRGERKVALSTGACVGLRSLLDDHPQGASVHTLTDVQALVLSARALLEIHHRLPELTRALLRQALRAPA